MSTFSEKPACEIITISAFLVILGHFIAQTSACLFIHFKQGFGTQADAYVNSQQFQMETSTWLQTQYQVNWPEVRLTRNIRGPLGMRCSLNNLSPHFGRLFGDDFK